MARLSRSQLESVLRLSTIAFGAVLDQGKWNEFIEAARVELGAANAVLGTYGPLGPQLSVTANYPTEALAGYAAYYSRLDPWTRAAQLTSSMPAGTVLTSEEIISEVELQRSEFYNDFGLYYGIVGGVGAIVDVSRGDRTAIAFSRSPRRAVPAGSLALVRALLPQLQIAVRASKALSACRGLADAALDALNAAAQPVLICDEQSAILHLNTLAGSLLAQRDGIQSEKGRLKGLTSDITSQLHASIRAATTLRGPSARAVSVARSGRRPLAVTIVPLKVVADSCRLAGIVIFDPDAAISDGTAVLRRLYGLTTSESAVAQLIAGGLTVREVAEALGVEQSTIRTHLKSLFGKTLTRRQAELVRLVCTIKTPLHGH